MAVAPGLSVSQGIGLSWASNAVQRQESQWDDELLTLPKASLGHGSACKIWQIQSIHLCSLLGGGLALDVSSKSKTGGERRSCFRPGGRQEAPGLLSPPVRAPPNLSFFSPHLDRWMNLNRPTSEGWRKDKDHFCLSPLRGDRSVFLTLDENYRT